MKVSIGKTTYIFDSKIVELPLSVFNLLPQGVAMNNDEIVEYLFNHATKLRIDVDDTGEEPSRIHVNSIELTHNADVIVHTTQKGE